MSDHLYKVVFRYFGALKTEEAWAFSAHDAVTAIRGAYWVFDNEGDEVFEVVSVEVIK